MEEETNLLSENLVRIQNATDSIRNITDTTGETIEAVAQAVSDLNDDNMAKDIEIVDLERQIEEITPKGTIMIIDNGTHDVSAYANAQIQVPSIMDRIYCGAAEPDATKYKYWIPVTEEVPIKMVDTCQINSYITAFNSDIIQMRKAAGSLSNSTSYLYNLCKNYLVIGVAGTLSYSSYMRVQEIEPWEEGETPFGLSYTLKSGSTQSTIYLRDILPDDISAATSNYRVIVGTNIKTNDIYILYNPTLSSTKIVKYNIESGEVTTIATKDTNFFLANNKYNTPYKFVYIDDTHFGLTYYYNYQSGGNYLCVALKTDWTTKEIANGTSQLANSTYSCTYPFVGGDAMLKNMGYVKTIPGKTDFQMRGWDYQRGEKWWTSSYGSTSLETRLNNLGYTILADSYTRCSYSDNYFMFDVAKQTNPNIRGFVISHMTAPYNSSGQRSYNFIIDYLIEPIDYQSNYLNNSWYDKVYSINTLTKKLKIRIPSVQICSDTEGNFTTGYLSNDNDFITIEPLAGTSQIILNGIKVTYINETSEDSSTQCLLPTMGNSTKHKIWISEDCFLLVDYDNQITCYYKNTKYQIKVSNGTSWVDYISQDILYL